MLSSELFINSNCIHIVVICMYLYIIIFQNLRHTVIVGVIEIGGCNFLIAIITSFSNFCFYLTKVKTKSNTIRPWNSAWCLYFCTCRQTMLWCTGFRTAWKDIWYWKADAHSVYPPVLTSYITISPMLSYLATFINSLRSLAQ